MTTRLDWLRSHDWTMTAQRRVVAEVLSGENVHLITADEVHALAVDRLPRSAGLRCTRRWASLSRWARLAK